MDSFETLVGSLLEKDGFWVRTSVKVELTPEEKRKIGRPSSPRWELDLVAYKAKSNELLVVECKSFLDSPGVRARGLDGTDKTACAGPRDARQDFQVSLAHSVRAGATIPGLAPLARASAARRSSGARFRRAPDARPPWLYGAMAWLLRPPGRAYLVLLASVLRTFHGSQRQRGNNPFQSHELAGLTYKKSAKIIKYTRQLQIAIPRERPHARSQTAVLYIRDQ